MLQRAHDQSVPAEPEGSGPAVDRLQERVGDVHGRWHEYIHEYITLARWDVQRQPQGGTRYHQSRQSLTH